MICFCHRLFASDAGGYRNDWGGTVSSAVTTRKSTIVMCRAYVDATQAMQPYPVPLRPPLEPSCEALIGRQLDGGGGDRRGRGSSAVSTAGRVRNCTARGWFCFLPMSDTLRITRLFWYNV